MAEHLDFPLLPGNADPCLTEEGSYPLTVSLQGASLPLFTAGVASSAQLSAVARRTAILLCERFAKQRLLLVDILEGGRVFGAMLDEEVATVTAGRELPWRRAALKVRSYGHGSQATTLRILAPLHDSLGREITDCAGFDGVVLVDDLIDAGLTAHGLVTDYLPRLGAREIGLCTMLNKARPRSREVAAMLDRCLLHAGLGVPNQWLVGHGLDMALPGQGTIPPLYLFRQALPGGVYAFNTAIETRLLAAYQTNPADIRAQLAAYLSEG